jgi:hypothetical protein
MGRHTMLPRKELALSLRVVVLVFLIPFLFSCVAARQPKEPKITVGDSVDYVRRMLGVTAQPTPVRSTIPGAQSLILKDRGISVFFNNDGKLYCIRLDAPFGRTIFGARIGELRQEVFDALGPPQKTLPQLAIPGRAAYIYTFNSGTSVRYDFGDTDRLETMLILAGSIDVPPVPKARIPEGRQRIAAGLQAAGQLAATRDLGCIRIEKVKPTDTAADLYRATRQCLDKDEYTLSAPLFLLAGTYGRFDTERIADKTVGGGISILIMNVGDGLTDPQKQGFMAAIETLHNDPQAHAAFCARVAAIGPPRYIPVYLTVHGLGVMGSRSDENGLIPDFDSAKSWAGLLRDGLVCSSD